MQTHTGVTVHVKNLELAVYYMYACTHMHTHTCVMMMLVKDLEPGVYTQNCIHVYTHTGVTVLVKNLESAVCIHTHAYTHAHMHTHSV